MNRTLLVALFLASCATPAPREYHQGAYRPAPPMFVPSQDAPHTVGQPGHLRPQREELPKSPHKRLLPPTREPGLWAGDEARAALGPQWPSKPMLGPVELPFPTDADNEEKTIPTRFCALSMSAALTKAKQHIRFQNMLAANRQACVAAHLNEYCAKTLLEAKQKTAAVGVPTNAAEIPAHQSALWMAQAFKTRMCGGAGLNPQEADIVRATSAVWHDVVKDGS